MQNKANLLKAKMNVNSFQASDYDDSCRFEVAKNKANSKPNKANFKKARMNTNSLLTKDYENESRRQLQENKPNQSQFPYQKLRSLFIIRAKAKRN